MPRILFIASHRRDRSPNQRFRFEQYLPYLQSQGFHCEVSHLVEASDDSFLYKPGHFLDKFCFVRRSVAKRRRDAARAKEFDVVFICREALMTRSTAFERAFRKSGARIVFDFDDSIWLSNVSNANRRWAWMKRPNKTARIIALSDMVFAGNAYLAEYARAYNRDVEVVPTTIDTEEYRPVAARTQGPITIGWSGSITTIQHFQHALPFLRILKERYGDRVAIRVIGDGSYREPDLGIQGIPWSKATELQDLAGIDIGIMPLPDDPWARGKCGLKGLQYMGLGLPTIMSPVGVNSEIIRDGANGYLAASTEEWVQKIATLVEDPDLRRRMGAEARRTVEERYSVHAWRDRYLTIFKNLIEERPKRT